MLDNNGFEDSFDSEKELQLECRDIVEMIKRYTAANRNKVNFVGAFFALKDEPKVKDGSDMIVAFGDIGTLRMLLNYLRDAVEEEKDEEGFVNI